ncbi:uncharacterized protein [Procambarus clarkii]|uniref:uncharacterized protein n=1 Tax=Procambarus clarkii TaxID=6728 RepID=UPI003743A657
MAPVPDTHVEESIVPRCFFQEVHELPIVASAAEKVTKTHNSLCKFVPLYQRVSSAALSTTRSLAHRASEYTLVKASVHKVEGLGLKAVTTLKNSCPIVKEPTEKVVEEVGTKVRQRVRLGRSRIATYLVFQTSCRVTEALVTTAERACAALIRKEAQVWTLLVPLAQQLKCLSPTQPLNSVERHLRNYRRSLRAWRRSGTVVPSGLHNLKVKRRKAGFLAWFWAPTQPAALESCVPRDSAKTRPRKKKSLPMSSPNKDKLSEGEERKLPQRKSEDKTMTYHDLLNDLLDYCSDEDSDYSPKETSTDSLAYRSTESEECEVSLTEDFKKSAVDGGKNTVENLNATAEESNVGQIKIIVTDHEAEGSQQQQEEQEQQRDGVGKCVDGNTN